MSNEAKSYGQPVTVRLAPELLGPIDGLCIMDQVSRAEMLRTVVSWYVRERQSDPELPSQIEAARTRVLDVFDALENWTPSS